MKYIILTAALSLASCINTQLDDSEIKVPEENVSDPMPAPPTQGQDTIRVLILGNSFAFDAIKYYFYSMSVEADVHIKTGLLPISSCTLKMHLDNAKSDAAAYEFRVQDFDGSVTATEGTRMSKAFASDNWDYVSIQQASDYSGKYASYQQALPELTKYIRSHTSAGTQIVFHQTWAYAPNCTRSSFKWYGSDQLTMYDSIMNATQRMMQEYDIDKLIPSGTALQNARTSALGNNLTRDGYHLDSNGQYTAACTWIEFFTGKCVIGSHVKPEGLSDSEVKALQVSAHNAIETPYCVTGSAELSLLPTVFADPK